MLSLSRFSFTFFLSVAITVLTQAQNIVSISGKVVDVKNEPFAGNVLMLSVNDSSLIKAGTLTNGTFELSNINQNEILLKLTSVLFNDTLLHIKYSGQQHVNIGTITVKEKLTVLNEVLVTSRVPLIKQAANGNIEVNVANTILATSNSVNEILSRTPNIMINDDGQIQVIGKGEAIIYLNGKLINNERMATIPTSQITKIEVILNPSSKYDAEGKAVINIITKMKTNEGWAGKIRQQLTISDFAGTSTNTFLDLSYGRGKLTMVGNYGLQTGKERELLHTIRNRPQTSEYLNSDITIDWNRKFSTYNNYGFGAQYNFSEKTNISLSYDGNRNQLRGMVNSKNAVTTNTDNNYFASDNATNNLRYNHSITLNFNRIIDSLGSAFFIGSQYNYYKGIVKDFIIENSIINNTVGDGRVLKNNSDQNVAISSTQTDYTKAFSSISKLETGAKFSYVTTGYTSYFYIGDINSVDYTLDSNLSSNFRYTEKIAAAYINYSSKILKTINFSIGTRGEWTKYTLYTSADNNRIIKDKYFNLFSSIQINIPVSAQLKFRGSYAARITRPRYQSLNPVIIYQDPLTTIEGNPYLMPEKTHAFEIGANYKTIDLKLGYNYIIDPMSGGAIRGNAPNSYVLKNFNIYKQHNYSASLSKTLTIKSWSSTNTVTLNYIKEIDNEYNFSFFTPKPYIYLYSNNTINVKNIFSLQLLAWYLGDRYLGLFYRKNIATLTAGIEKNFFKNSVKVNFIANDILHNFIATGNYNVGQTDIYFHRSYTTNYFRLTATYNFGSSKKAVYKSKATGQSESNRVE